MNKPKNLLRFTSTRAVRRRLQRAQQQQAVEQRIQAEQNARQSPLNRAQRRDKKFMALLLEKMAA
jgi:hypothetical protein